ncbi:MAG: hypothetical protein V3U80_00845 [Flavobacteriaceae bacterium]
MSRFWKILIPILLVITILFWKVTRNKIDPIWSKIENLDLSKVETLEKSTKKLNVLYEEFHHKKPSHKSYGIDLISKPYVPIMEYSKFENFIRALNKEKYIIISGVEGGGSTTLVRTLAKFIAENDNSRILNVMCAPQFDLIYHKKYIGETINGKFHKGELLKFWEQCLANPDKKYIAIFDDLDKVNPETLLGPDVWAHLTSSNHKLVIGGKTIKIPDNYFMLSTTLSAVGSRVQLHNEHFKRIGKDYYLQPSYVELALYLDRVKKKLNKKVIENGISSLSKIAQKQHNSLNDKRQVLEFLYLFAMSNNIIEKDVSRSNQLAQWSSLRKLYLPKQRNDFINTFVSHVNAMHPDIKFDKNNFNPIFYTFKNNGLQKGSSSLALGFKVFKEWGFLTEFVVAICFALITALVGLYMSGKRKKKVTKFLIKSEEVYNDFETRKINPEEAVNRLDVLKVEIENHTRDNKISFPEAIFFYNSVRSKVNSIEITKNINTTFLVLMDVFLDDEELSLNEYEKLTTFLEKIKSTISESDFIVMKKQVDDAWNEFGDK